MRLLLIMDETGFYQPDFVARFVEPCADDIVAIGLVTDIPVQSNIERYMIRHFYYLRPLELIRLAYQKIKYALYNRLMSPKKGGRFYSVKAVAVYNGIEHFEIQGSINKKKYIDMIRSYQPDIILSSNSLYFGKKLLALPRIVCLNRHSGLLPAYGGLWSVFQAVRSGEATVGVTVHVMASGIDKGAVIAQKEVIIEEHDTVADLYIKCFTISAEVLLQAVQRVKEGDMSPVKNTYKESYFSFPAKEHWVEFRKRNRRFI